MDPAEELAVCNHCKKEVVKTNLPMHEAHCQRFLCICPDCDEQVPKDHLEEHQQEQHAPVKCKKCNMKMEKRMLPDHDENECPERDQSCEYCELTLPLSSLKEHIVACGSRTERCQDCNQYVILKDKLQHAQICTSEDFSFKTNSINGNVKPVPVNAPQDNELADLVAYDSRDKRVLWDVDAEPEDTTLSLSDLQKKKKWTEKMGWKDEDQISTCPYCHLALPLNTLQWHKNKCWIFEALKRMSKAADASVKK